MHAQISSQTQLLINVHHISKVMNGLTLFFTNELLNFENNVGQCGTDGLPHMFIIANGRLNTLMSNRPFKYLSMVCAFFPEHYCKHFLVLSCTFLRSVENFMETYCSFLIFTVNLPQTPHKNSNTYVLYL